jgi:adenylate cyclase
MDIARGDLMKKLEIERRWLVKLPLSDLAEKAIMNDPDAPARITQTYLRSDDGTVKRLRFVQVLMWGVPFSHYLRTEKKLIEQGVNEEEEHSLTEAEYQLDLMERDTTKHTLDKTRYHIHHGGELFQLDVFHGQHEGLAILELEQPHVDWEKTIDLPPYLSIDREITHEKGWSNFELASQPEKELGWFGKVIGWLRPKGIDAWL